MVTILGNSYMRPDFFTAAATGTIPGVSVIKKFGFNPAVSAAVETIWDEGGLYSYIPTPSQLTVSSTATTDNPASTGAHTVVLLGLDSNMLELPPELLTMDGQNPVTTGNTYSRVYRAFVQTAGASGCSDGTIRFGTGAVAVGVPANVFASILPTLNQSRMGLYTIPSDKTGLLYQIYTNSGEGKEVEVQLFARDPGSVFKLQGQTNIFENVFVTLNLIPFVLPPSTDIETRAASSAVGASVNVALDIMLISNDVPIR
jgi:hypothetical protein